MKPLTEIKVFGDGHTEPNVPSKTCILMIQDGQVTVGRLVLQHDQADPVYIEHPVNQDELNLKAISLIKKSIPTYLKRQDLLLLICPDELAREMKWQSII